MCVAQSEQTGTRATIDISMLVYLRSRNGKNCIFHDSRSWSKSPQNSLFGLRASPESACAILGSTPWRESLAGPPRATSTAQRHRRDPVPDGPHTLSTEGVSYSVARAPRASRAPACAILESTQRREALAGPPRATSTAQRNRGRCGRSSSRC